MNPTLPAANDADLTSAQIRGLIGRHDPTTGIQFPPPGLQPYHDWLIRTLHRLAAASLGAFAVRVAADDPASVAVAPGRASIDSQAVSLPATTLDLAIHNNLTCHIALTAAAGQAQLSLTSAADGWPADPHLKLAEVTLVGGAVTDILDRRLETLFRV